MENTLRQLKSNITISREDWAKAEARWLSYRRDLSQSNAKNTRQIGLEAELNKNIKALNGLSVLIIRSYDGYVFNGYPYRGMVLKAKKVESVFYVTVLYFPSEREEWYGERIEELQLYQIEQVQDVFMPDEKELKRIQMEALVRAINDRRNQTVINLQAKKKDYAYSITARKREIKKYEKEIENIETQIGKVKIDKLSIEEVIKMFTLLGKHKKVYNAYIDANQNMIVISNMLYATDPKTLKENKNEPIGRFAMKLSLQGISNCTFINLDYCGHHESGCYSHPNIGGIHRTACTGENQSMLDKYARSGQFYELADFLLLFFSLFPQDSGSPYLRYELWLKYKKLEPHPNPYKTKDKLWELYPGKKIRALPKPKVKKTPLTDFLNQTSGNTFVGVETLDPTILSVDSAEIRSEELNRMIRDMAQTIEERRRNF